MRKNMRKNINNKTYQFVHLIFTCLHNKQNIKNLYIAVYIIYYQQQIGTYQLKKKIKIN